MFKDKHEYTCPDVIHLLNKAKRNQKIALATNFGFLGALWLGGTIAAARDRRKPINTPESTPDPTEE